MVESTEAPAPMTLFERYLSLWVFVCIVLGVALVSYSPGCFRPWGLGKWRK